VRETKKKSGGKERIQEGEIGGKEGQTKIDGRKKMMECTIIMKKLDEGKS